MPRVFFSLRRSILLIGICGCISEKVVNSQPPVTASPIAPSALIQRLEDVDYCARMNALYDHGSMDSELAIYFADKADEVEGVLDRLKKGKKVPADEIERALDTSDAQRIGGYPC